MSDAVAGTVAAFEMTQVYFESNSNGSSGAADLTPAFLSRDFQGAISYCPRSVIDSDHAKYDDVLTLIAPWSELYSAFVLNSFVAVASAFESYRATVALDEDLDLDDFDRIVDLNRRTGLDSDGRDGVFRIGPVNVFDDELCIRAFNLNAADVVRRVLPYTEVARLFDQRAFFLVTSRLVGRGELLAIDYRIKNILMGRR